MAETPAPPAAPGGATETPAPSASAQPLHKPLSIRDLLDAGVHFGHQTRRWNPRMKPFLFGERNGVHIVDLDQTLPRFQAALDFVRETVAQGGKVLFVGTKRQAEPFIESEAQRSEQFYVSRRWLGGMLTNFKTVRKSIDRFKELLEIVGDEEKAGEIAKKELSKMNREIEKYKKSLDGIKEMTRLPDALFVIDVKREAIAVKEGNRLGIPIVAVVDSNCDPDTVDHVIPGNDDSTRAIKLYCERVADACIEGAAEFNARVQSEVADEERAKAAGESDKRATGRVVVEIKQQPRRGRGAHSAGLRAGREGEREPAAEKSAAAEKPAAEKTAPAEKPAAAAAPEAAESAEGGSKPDA